MTASTGSRTRDPRLQLGHALPVRSVNAGHAPLPAVPASNAYEAVVSTRAHAVQGCQRRGYVDFVVKSKRSR